jgi:hypothetical protein
MTSLGANRGGMGWQIFERICMEAMTGDSLYSSQYKECIGQEKKSSLNHELTSTKQTKKIKEYETVNLGGCHSIKCCYGDIVKAARETPSVVFYSGDPSYKLIDFVYQKDGIFFAFQVTLGQSHDANVKNIKKLADSVGGPQFLHLYYLVPHFNFNQFKTNPVNPALQLQEKYANVNWNVHAFMIKDPNSPKRTTSINDPGFNADSVRNE